MLDASWVELVEMPSTKNAGHESIEHIFFLTQKRGSVDSTPTKDASESLPGSPKSPVTSHASPGRVIDMHVKITKIAEQKVKTEEWPTQPSARAPRPTSFTGPPPEDATSRPGACATDFSSSKSAWTASYPTTSDDFDFWYQSSAGRYRGSGNLFTDYLRWNALRTAEESMMHNVSAPVDEEIKEQSGSGDLFSDVRDRLLHSDA